MIRRLVEQQDVRLADERPREQHAAPPSARQRVDNRVRGKLKARQDQIDVMFTQPHLVLVEMMRVALGDHVEDRTIGGQRDVLFETREAKRRLTPHGSSVRRELARDDFQKRRLARPVATDDRHALARIDLKRDLVQQRKMTERDRDAIERNERHPST